MTYVTIYDFSAVRLLKVFYFCSWETFLLLDTFFFTLSKNSLLCGEGYGAKVCCGCFIVHTSYN